MSTVDGTSAVGDAPVSSIDPSAASGQKQPGDFFGRLIHEAVTGGEEERVKGETIDSVNRWISKIFGPEQDRQEIEQPDATVTDATVTGDPSNPSDAGADQGQQVDGLNQSLEPQQGGDLNQSVEPVPVEPMEPVQMDPTQQGGAGQ